MSRKRRPVVTFVTRILTHYRIPFHERVRTLLAAQGIEYRLIHGQPDGEEAVKGDLATTPWAMRVSNRAFLGRGKLVWQPVLRATFASDLIVIGQENQLLVNYPLQLIPRRLRPKIALWGHGRNFQSRDPDGRAERWKRFWARRCDWWFGYTDETRRHVESLGFPPERITVFNNSVDTSGLRAMAASIEDAESRAAAAAIGAQGDHVAIFVGGLYPDKRLEFLVAAADRVRVRAPDFTLIVAGGGVDRPMLERLAETRPWLIVAGPKFGREKVALMRAAKLFLMPGLVGLAVLDAAATGLPMVTTGYPYHSPEIAYLRDGENGVIVADWQNVDAYADMVADLMLDEPRRARLATAARGMADVYTVEAMAERFAAGVVAALA